MSSDEDMLVSGSSPVIRTSFRASIMQQVNLGIIGGGTVGGGVYQALASNGSLMASRIGVRVAVRKVAVKSPGKRRPHAIPRSLLT
ncbi:MAG: hypothetical protein ACREE6_15095, partial [Limisphaerales bacterium]